MSKHDVETKMEGVVEKTAPQIHEDRVAKLVLLMIWTGAEYQAVADALNIAGLATADGSMWDTTKVRQFIKSMSE